MSDDENYQKTQNITGAINLIRLIGDGKVLYVFFDYPVKAYKCKNKYTLTIDQFFTREFDKMKRSNNKIIYDFYLERTLSNVQTSERVDKSYLEDLSNKMASYMKFDKKGMEISHIGENLRIHLIDVRDNIIQFLKSRMDSILHFISVDNFQAAIQEFPVVLNCISALKTILAQKTELRNKPSKFIDMLQKARTDQGISEVEANEYLIKIINKLYGDYKSDIVKKPILGQMKKLIVEMENVSLNVKDIFDKIYNLNKSINSDSYKKKSLDGRIMYGIPCATYQTEKAAFYHELENWIYNVSVVGNRIMNLYFIRRFLDKSYATNGIFYGNAWSACDIVHQLVKNYGFKVTHFSHSTILDISELNNSINKTDDVNLVCDIFYPFNLAQCVHLENFPANFM